MSPLIGIVTLIIVLSVILIRSELQYRKDQTKKRRMAAIRESHADSEDKKISARDKKRAEKFGEMWLKSCYSSLRKLFYNRIYAG